MHQLTDDQIEYMVVEVDKELEEINLRQRAYATMYRGPQASEPLMRQKAAIFQETGVQPKKFLQLFREAAKKDLCQPGGLMFGQLDKLKGAARKDVMIWASSILASMGLTNGIIPTVAVVVIVYIMYIGSQAFCSWE